MVTCFAEIVVAKHACAVYIFPCVGCQNSPAQQVRTCQPCNAHSRSLTRQITLMVNNLGSLKYGMIWSVARLCSARSWLTVFAPFIRLDIGLPASFANSSLIACNVQKPMRGRRRARPTRPSSASSCPPVQRALLFILQLALILSFQPRI